MEICNSSSWDSKELGFTESQNHLGWKRPLRSSSPIINLTLPSPPLNHVPKPHIYISFKYLQGWWLYHFPGWPVSVLDNPFGEEIFPNIMAHSYSWVLHREERGIRGRERKVPSDKFNRKTKNLLLSLLPEIDLVYYETDFSLQAKKPISHKLLYK